MRVALFVPCYVDQMLPRVGWAAVEVLEAHGASVDFRRDQTCCGQALLNSGDPESARALARRFLKIFAGADHVVAPSASCVAMVRQHYRSLLSPGAELEAVCSRTLELCEFLVGVAGGPRLGGRFPHRVGLQPSCHGLRELGLGRPSELGGVRSEGEAEPADSLDPARQLLEALDGLELVAPARPDECCGFGGSFSVSEAEVSSAMGCDRIRAMREAGAEVVTATDASCLVHLDGLVRRQGAPLRVMHVAEILAGAEL